MEESTNNNSSTSKIGIIIGAIFLVLVAGGGYYYWSSQITKPETSRDAAMMEDDSEGDTMAPTTMMEDNMTMQMEASSASESSESATAVMEGENQIITVEGGNFYFKPNQIKVKAGTPVKLTLKNAQGFHDFVIDELDVKTTQITAGKSETVEFTPTKKGSYEFYCSVGQHRQMGMKGTLIVE